MFEGCLSHALNRKKGEKDMVSFDRFRRQWF
jgi:hypothetical protein